MNKILEKIKNKFEIVKYEQQREDLFFLTSKKKDTEAVLNYLKNYENFTHLAFLQAVDFPEESKFRLTYMLYNYTLKKNLAVQTDIERENPEMISIHHLWKHAWQYQRELNEMFGIFFPNSPHVEESFVLEGWDNIPPMRRDFDTKKYVEETFYPRPGRETNDTKEHMRKKLYNKFVQTPKKRREDD